MNKLEKTPVTIITGFLGSGKTTLLHHLMQNAGDKRLAIIVNEFGTLGMDGEILKSCADENCPAENIVELSNGCICCTVADDFIPSMEAILKLDPAPDHILIETSGLALPKPLLMAFEWPEIRSQITVDGVIALADSEAVAAGRFAHNVDAVDAQRKADESLDHESPLAEVFEDQIACADIVLLTKADLVDEIELAKAKAIIADHSPREIPILSISEGVVDTRVMLGLNSAAEDDLEARPSHHDGAHDHEHDDFESISIEIGEYKDIETIVEKVESLARSQNILRTKGYVAIEGKPMRLLVQAVGDRVRAQYDRPWGDAPRISTLVVIAEHDDIHPDKIRAHFS